MVAHLEKTDGNTEFHETIDFLTRSSIHYALTACGNISKAINIEVISFCDADKDRFFYINQDYLINIQPNGVHEGDTYYLYLITKPCFHISGDFFFFTMESLPIMSKSTSWDQIPTNIATAVICLATNQKYNFSKLIFDGMMRHLDAKKKFVMYPRFISVFLDKQLKNVHVPLDHFPINALTSKVFSFMVKKGKHFSGNVTPLFESMLVQPTKDEDQHEIQADPSPRPSPTIPIPDSIPEGSGGNHGGQSSSDRSLSGNEDGLTLQSVYDLCVSLCKQVTDQAKEIKHLKAQIKKLKKKAKPVITHHKAWMKSVSMNQRWAGKKSFKTKWMQNESVSKQGRKPTKSDNRQCEDWEAEEEMKKLAEEEATKAALIQDFDDIQAKIEADRLLAARLQEEERETFTVEERATFLYDTIAAQRRFLAQQRAATIRSSHTNKNSDKKLNVDISEACSLIKGLYFLLVLLRNERTLGGGQIKEMNEESKDPKKKRVVNETPREEDTTKVPTEQEVIEQGTKTRKSGHVKMIARKRPRPQPDDDSDDGHRKCLKIVTLDSTIDSEIMETKSFVSKLHKVSSPDGDYLVVYRVNGHFRAFNYLMEGDLKIMMESSTKENDQVKRRLPLLKELLQRMLDLGLEVEEEVLLLSTFVKSWLVQDQTVPVQKQTAFGKDKSNPLIVDSLLKTIRLSIHLVVYNEELAIPEQTATGKGISNPLMAGSLPKTTKPTWLSQAPRDHGGTFVQTRFERASKLSYDSSLGGGNTPQSDKDSMALQELTDLCTKFSDRVLAFETDLRQTKKVYGTAYTKLIMKVKKLEKTVKTSQARRRAKIVVSDDDMASKDSSKQGRMIEEIDQDAGVTLVTPIKVSSQEDQLRDQLGVLSATKVLADAARVHTYSRRRRAVSTGSGGVSTASRIVSTAGMIQQVNIIIPSSSATKDKGKAIMTKSEPKQTTTKSKQRQERAGYEAAIRLQEQLDEEERQRITRDAKGFTEDEWEDIRARVEADEELTQKLQAEERDKYSEVDQARMLHVSTFTSIETKDKERESELAVGSSKRPRAEHDDKESIKKQKLEENDVEKEELRACLDIVPGDEIAMDFESLATKYPIID
ncbi:hypothetical protein Tco_1155712 [Tanacetum coccineum]